MSSSLSQIIQQLSTPLEAIPTEISPKLPKLEGIKAVVFDIYGTLLISASGDISLASEGSRGQAAIEACQSVGFMTDLSGDRIVELLLQAIKKSHAESNAEYPEVEIRDCWREALGTTPTDNEIDRVAVEYECRVNPIWPMPNLAETLGLLNRANIKLGIVSNAQFYTPLAFEPLTGKSLAEWQFLDPLCHWSYLLRQAKPGTRLYQNCRDAAHVLELLPEEILYIGNDMRNDVWPASLVGFKTALFAGDQRSLRLRNDDPCITEVKPDVILTDLTQIATVLGIDES